MSGNFFNDPRINVSIRKKCLDTYLMILVSMCPYEKNLETYLIILVSMCPYENSGKIFVSIKVPIRKKSGNLFNDPRINKCPFIDTRIIK